MTMWVARRIRSLFEPYVIDAKTDIVVNRRLDETHPLYQYFMLLKQHIGFKLMGIEREKIVNRIIYYFTGKTMKRPSFKKAWELTIRKKVCPWITQEIEYKIQNKGPSDANRIRMVRLGLFYVVVKNYYYSFSKKR